MLKVTMPSSSSSSSAAGRAPDYWIDGSNKDTLAHYFELESELGRVLEMLIEELKNVWSREPHWYQRMKQDRSKHKPIDNLNIKFTLERIL